MTKTTRPGQPARMRPLTVWRLAVSVTVGIVAAALTIIFGSWRYAPGVAWSATAIVFCAWIWLAIWPLSASQTQSRATAEDPNRAVSDILMLSACVASLAALGVVLASAHAATGMNRFLLALLGVVSVAASWFTVHTVFTLRYAVLFYTQPIGGIDFNQEEWPDYRDFAYVALTLGMTFQVSDTGLRNSQMRSTALRHALLSYLFGSVILAATVNLVAGLGIS